MTIIANIAAARRVLDSRHSTMEELREAGVHLSRVLERQEQELVEAYRAMDARGRPQSDHKGEDHANDK